MMNPSLVAKLDSLLERHEELQHLLSAAEVIAVQEKFRSYSKEYAELEPVVEVKRRARDGGGIGAAAFDFYRGTRRSGSDRGGGCLF